MKAGNAAQVAEAGNNTHVKAVEFHQLLDSVSGGSNPKGMNDLRSDETSGITKYVVEGMFST